MTTQIEKEALEYVQNDKTVAETAQLFGISKRIFQIHLKKLLEINPELHNLVLNKQKSNIIAGRIKGGTLGKRGTSYTPEEAIEVAKFIITNQATYEEASIHFEIPTSTISDMMHSNILPEQYRMQLEVVAEANRHKMSTEELIERKRQKW